MISWTSNIVNEFPTSKTDVIEVGGYLCKISFRKNSQLTLLEESIYVTLELLSVGKVSALFSLLVKGLHEEKTSFGNIFMKFLKESNTWSDTSSREIS
jgi:hypothetical protein